MAREKIYFKNQQELNIMRENGRVLAQLFEKYKEILTPGITTYDLDRIAEEFMLSKGGKPSFKGYQGFPGSICSSVNQVVIHGIPDEKTVLQEGILLVLI